MPSQTLTFDHVQLVQHHLCSLFPSISFHLNYNIKSLILSEIFMQKKRYTLTGFDFRSIRFYNYYRSLRFIVIQDGRQSLSLIFSDHVLQESSRRTQENKICIKCSWFAVDTTLITRDMILSMIQMRYDPFNDSKWPLAVISIILISPNFKGWHTLNLK